MEVLLYLCPLFVIFLYLHGRQWLGCRFVQLFEIGRGSDVSILMAILVHKLNMFN